MKLSRKITLFKIVCWFFLILNVEHLAAWYDSNAAGTAPDWHYRVPVNISAGSPVNSTIKLNVNFNTLMTQLGISGTFDNNSPRIVRPNETLASTQEYTDRIYNGVLDPASNARGEIKFILQDAGPATYYLYFDVLANGSKPANPRPTINGNFEHSSGTTPTNWSVSNVNANGAQNDEVHDTSYGSNYNQAGGTPTCSDQLISNADNSPNNAGSAATTTGRKWFLSGYRNNCEDGIGNNRENIRLSRSISVPASNPGTLTFYFQLQAFDSWDGATRYDYFKLLANNTTVNHSSLGISNPGNVLRIANGGIGRRNTYSALLIDAGWKKATLNLTPYQGMTIPITFITDFYTDNGYRTWVKLDDIEWSIRTATLGTPEAQPPVISVQKTSLVVSDGINASDPKRIPGAIVEYTITVVNSGFGSTDNNSIVINDAIPADTEFVVNSLQFSNGTPSSGLTATSANFSYSIDGISYNTTQSTATRYIRVSPQGSFAAATSAGNPSFQIKFKIKVN